ncbi:hypothetical protein DSO57_1011782 [Entomophthora muscae]|uniref:Uncharacterized protein n=1 Tax=Entomophthora muscae TaxID=34485 RepID=A0ACC2TH87_9FUNG|nr:hypothetical protein DSO57_1011782 [Entomophthora muscae]
MTFLQYPCPQSSPKVASLLVWLATRQRSSALLIQAKFPEMSSVRSRRLLMKAEQAYFDHAGTFIPLFSKSSFHTQPRSELLKAAVLATGLLWCDKDPFAKKLGRYLNSYLETATTPARLNFSLDTLQAILIIVLGLFGAPWVLNRMEYFGMLSLRIAYALGLQASRPGQEHALTASCLMYLINYLSITDMPFTCVLLPIPRTDPSPGSC